MNYRTVGMQRVIRFMERARKKVPRYPTNIVSDQEARLCAKLFLEEAFEYVRELGFEYKNGQLMQVSGNVDLPKLAVEGFQAQHALLYGLATYGIADVGPSELVDGNENLKFMPGHRFEDGRLIPPPGFSKHLLADAMEAEIERQIHEGVGTA